MGGAQRIPIAGIPEKGLIASMGYPMVNHRRRLSAAFGLAADAQRVRFQEGSPRFLPTVAIATLCRCLVTGAPAADLHPLHAAGIKDRKRALQGL
jgi:hypothetical protein